MAAINSRIEAFIKNFYEMYDKSRTQINQMYQEVSMVIWNGNVYRGLATLDTFFKQMPPTSHCLETIDWQSVVAADVGTILVQVTGTVTYGVHLNSRFSQAFMLAPTGSTIPNSPAYFIAYDCVRNPS